MAIGLHRAGFATVICDDIDPPWARRGMAFTNAWYLGNAELDGEAAIFCASAKSVPTILQREDLIAATAWSWHGIAMALDPVAIIEARPWRGRVVGTPKARAPARAVTIGIGHGYVPGIDVDIGIESAPAGQVGAAVAGGATASAAGAMGLIEVAGPTAHVNAARGGHFATSRRIGDRVRQGEVVGAIGNAAVVAPIDGALRGLSARGAAVFEGALIVEVDPRGDPILCFGVDERAGRIAQRALSALMLRLSGATSGLESGPVPTPA